MADMRAGQATAHSAAERLLTLPFAAVALERQRQDERWGEQNHPDGTGLPWQKVEARDRRDACERAAEAGGVTWRHILDEEVAEAFAEDDPRALHDELLQVAAVAIAWAEAIERRSAR